jgi:hypothetical protein
MDFTGASTLGVLADHEKSLKARAEDRPSNFGRRIVTQHTFVHPQRRL